MLWYYLFLSGELDEVNVKQECDSGVPTSDEVPHLDRSVTPEPQIKVEESESTFLNSDFS